MPTICFANEAKDVFAREGANLRRTALENDIDVYKRVAKLTNCGGVGRCGTCVMEVVEGMEHLSSRTQAEDRKLKRRPESYRLACQTKVMGDVTVKTKP